MTKKGFERFLSSVSLLTVNQGIMNQIVYVNGDGAYLEDEKPLIDYLADQGFEVMFIPLKESGPQVSYQELSAESYCQYIDSMLPKEFTTFTMLAISKGCAWSRIYAAKNTKRVKKLVLIEPTTLTPELLAEFENARGNSFINEFHSNPAEVTREDNTKTALDVLVSDHTPYIPRCPTVIIWTSRDTQNRPYDNYVLGLKRKFERYLRSKGVRLSVIHVDGPHYIATEPRYFKLISNALK